MRTEKTDLANIEQNVTSLTTIGPKLGLALNSDEKKRTENTDLAKRTK